jgi:hypothetical protein
MIFPKIDTENLVQIQDMFRISGVNSFATAGEEITEVNIYPDYINNPGTVFDVYEPDQECWFLDWAYETDGSYKVRLELVTASSAKAIEQDIVAITEAEDNLFSTDQMLYAYESELRVHLPDGRNSWKYIHRKAQEEILDYLYRNGKLNSDGSAITKAQLTADSKLDKWSTFEAMVLIYQDLKTSNSAAFTEKLEDYSAKKFDARKRYVIRFDSDQDGDIDEEDDKIITTRTAFLSR